MKYRQLMLDWTQAACALFDTLSDGQRGMVALLADIARRMCLLNPQLGDAVLSDTPGVVLIDELDLHLHPAWQRRLPGSVEAGVSARAVYYRLAFAADDWRAAV